MNKWRLYSLIALLAFAGPVYAATPAIDPDHPPEGRFSDEWMEIYMNGAKVGYGHMTMTRRGDTIETRADTSLHLGRVDLPVKMSIVQQSTETIGGLPLSFGSEMDLSAAKTRTKGTIRDGRVTIVSSQFGVESTQAYDFPAGALMSWGAFREQVLRGFEPGTKYTVQMYAPELRLDGPIAAHTLVGEWEVFEHDGKKLEGRKVTVSLESPIGTMDMVSWVNKDGIPIKAKVPMAGFGDMVMIVTDQKTALADFVPPEIFMTTAVAAKRPIDHDTVQTIKFRVRAKDGGDNAAVELDDLPQTAMQSCKMLDDGSMELIVTRRDAEPTGNSAAGDEPKSNIQDATKSASLEEFLEANLMINTADPELINLARRAAGDEKDPLALADTLRRFVTDYIDNKSLNIGFATASEVARTKEGDCSEHGVLLAALGRLQGLPSRVVVGLAYVPIFGQKQDIFGYHMWTQFYINGQWIDFDAALRESRVNPARIAFATSSLKNIGLADLSLPLISKIGAIDIDILEIDGKPVK